MHNYRMLFSLLIVYFFMNFINLYSVEFVTIINWNNEKYSYALEFLKNNETGLENKNSRYILYKSEKSIIILVNLLVLIDKKIETARQNINEMNNTKYNRQFIELQNNGKFIIKKDDKSKFKLKYDPTHPDSIKTGKYKGYLKLPDIDYSSEINILINSIYIYNQVVEILKLFDNSIILEKRSISEINYLAN